MEVTENLIEKNLVQVLASSNQFDLSMEAPKLYFPSQHSCLDVSESFLCYKTWKVFLYKLSWHVEKKRMLTEEKSERDYKTLKGTERKKKEKNQ